MNKSKDQIDNGRAIKVTCETVTYLPVESLTPIQGNFKELSTANFEKLKKSLIKYGISFPVFIWKNNGTNAVLDGTQRDRVLNEMKKEGWQIPPVPVVYVQAKNEKEAKEKILLLSSQYGKYTMDSFYSFINDADLAFKDLAEMIDLPQFDLGKFEDFYLNDDVQPVSADEQSRLDQKSPIECPNCGTSFVPK